MQPGRAAAVESKRADVQAGRIQAEIHGGANAMISRQGLAGDQAQTDLAHQRVRSPADGVARIVEHSLDVHVHADAARQR